MNNIPAFQTHTSELVCGRRLTDALDKVANDWAELGRRIRMEDAYANHVSEEQKDNNLKDMLDKAECIKRGYVGGFTIWQRINEYLTGKCVPLFPEKN